MISIEPAGENAVRGKVLDAGREHAGSDAGQTGFKVLESARGMEKEIAEDEDSPSVADDIEGAGDGAAHGVFSGHGMLFH